MTGAEDLVCWECVADPVLRQWLRDTGHVGVCSFCGSRRIACPLREVAERIDAAIRQFYRPGEHRAHVVPDSDNLKYWEDGEPATEIIQQVAGVEPEVAAAVDEYLSAAEERNVRDGDDAYYGGTPLEHIDAFPDEFMDIWVRFEDRLKHQVRFFDNTGKELLDELFADLPTIAGGNAIVTLEPGGEFATLHRARIVDDDSGLEAFIRDPARQIGPPPPHLARAGRMNPVGIPVFYGAFSEEVAVAEVRPPVGAIVAVAKFSLLRSVRLLDVSFLPFAYHEESIFSPTYDRLRNKVRFLEKFHRRISRPVLPSDEALEYLPTQAVAAYVANVMGLDGMIYGSIQIGAEGEWGQQVDRRVCNVVLFGEAAKVEGADPPPPPGDHPEPAIFFPGLPRPAIEPPPPSPPIGPLPDTNPLPVDQAQPPSARDGAHVATLRAEPQPKLVKVQSVKLETSPIFAHLYENGSVIIDDFDDED